MVAIRPDVPGKRFDPGDANVLRTDDDRAVAQIALAAVYHEAKARRGQPPEWALSIAEADAI